MRKFEFSLEKLERVREIEIDRAALSHARCGRERLRTESELEAHVDNLRESFESLRVKEGSSLNTSVLLEQALHLEVIQQRIESSHGELEKALRVEENSRLELLEKAKKKKVVSRFHEIKLEEYEKDSRREEQKELDDIAGKKLDGPGAG